MDHKKIFREIPRYFFVILISAVLSGCWQTQPYPEVASNYGYGPTHPGDSGGTAQNYPPEDDYPILMEGTLSGTKIPTPPIVRPTLDVSKSKGIGSIRRLPEKPMIPVVTVSKGDFLDCNCSKLKVKKLQCMLNAMGYTISKDGSYGEETDAAVKDFKTQYIYGENNRAQVESENKSISNVQWDILQSLVFRHNPNEFERCNNNMSADLKDIKAPQKTAR